MSEPGLAPQDLEANGHRTASGYVSVQALIDNRGRYTSWAEEHQQVMEERASHVPKTWNAVDPAAVVPIAEQHRDAAPKRPPPMIFGADVSSSEALPPHSAAAAAPHRPSNSAAPFRKLVSEAMASAPPSAAPAAAAATTTAPWLPESPPFRAIVRGLPSETSEADIREAILDPHHIRATQVQVARPGYLSRSLTSSQIELGTRADLSKLLAMDHMSYHGLRLRVQLDRRPEPVAATRGRPDAAPAASPFGAATPIEPQLVVVAPSPRSPPPPTPPRSRSFPERPAPEAAASRAAAKPSVSTLSEYLATPSQPNRDIFGAARPTDRDYYVPPQRTTPAEGVAAAVAATATAAKPLKNVPSSKGSPPSRQPPPLPMQTPAAAAYRPLKLSLNAFRLLK